MENVFVMNIMGVYPHEIFVRAGLAGANFSYTVFVFSTLYVMQPT